MPENKNMLKSKLQKSVDRICKPLHLIRLEEAEKEQNETN